MNNSNGPALLASVRPGDLVTIRLPDGAQRTGRASYNGDTRDLIARVAADAMPVAVTAANIVRLAPGDRRA